MSEEQIDFSCRVCGIQCAIAPDPPGRAVCEDHCEDHEYIHCPDERGWFCTHCWKEQPYEPSEDDICFPMTPRDPSIPLGIPLSQVSGDQLDRIASEWREQ